MTLYKDKYEINWCGLCQASYVKCPVCETASCTGGGCDFCVKEFEEFNKWSDENNVTKEWISKNL